MEVPQIAQPEVHRSSPGLGWYTDHILFHEVWNRAGLAKRDRGFVVLSALVTLGHDAQLPGHLNRALDNGALPLQIVELITHLAFFSGWPRAMSALAVVRRVFPERGIKVDTHGQSTGRQPRENRLQDYPSEGDQAFGMMRTAIAQTSDRIVLEDLWARAELSRRDRSLITISSLISSRGLEELERFIFRAISDGLGTTEIAEAIAHLSFYAGRSSSIAAAQLIDALLLRNREQFETEED